jgi:hypothetical protein
LDSASLAGGVGWTLVLSRCALPRRYGLFGATWLHHVRKSGISNMLVAASDMPTAQALVRAGVPCFEFWTNPRGWLSAGGLLPWPAA